MGFWGIIGAGWRGAFGAARQNISLFALTFLAVLVISAIMQPMFPPLHWEHHSATHADAAKPFDQHLWLLEIIQGLLLSVATAPSMLAVHRFILLQEHGTALNSGRRLTYFTVWITAFHFVPSLQTEIDGFLSFIFFCVVCYSTTRLIMSFPAIAMDARNPLRDSWSRTQGHWWEVTGVMVFGFLPIIALAVVPLALEANEAMRIIVVTIAGCIWPAVGAALASELYRKFGGLVGQEPIHGLNGPPYTRNAIPK